MYSTQHTTHIHRKQQKAFSIPLDWEQSHLREGHLLHLLLCGYFRRLFSGPQHKRSQMYFLTTEVRRAHHQWPSSSRSLRKRGNHQARRPLMDEPEASTSYSLSLTLVRPTLLWDKIEHSSIINTLTDTLCQNNNSVAESRDELKRSLTLHYCDVDDGLVLTKSRRAYVQGRLKGVRRAIGWEEMVSDGIWPLSTPVGFRDIVC